MSEFDGNGNHGNMWFLELGQILLATCNKDVIMSRAYKNQLRHKFEMVIDKFGKNGRIAYCGVEVNCRKY